MSIQAVAWALDQDLPARPKLVLVAIANHANHKDGYCWLKAETIAAEAACTPRSVFRFVGGLIRNGYLRRQARRGDDGKQRATDYWILFDRAETEWDWGAGLEFARDKEANEQAVDDDDIQDQGIDEPDGKLSYGKSEEIDSKRPVESYGPRDSCVTLKNTAEPSKTNLKSGTLSSSVPRRYKRPAPEIEIVGSKRQGEQEKPFFLYDNTRLYNAWARYKARESGLATWHCVTSVMINGKLARGWYFPSMAPPGASEHPPPSELMTDQDVQDFIKIG